MSMSSYMRKLGERALEGTGELIVATKNTADYIFNGEEPTQPVYPATAAAFTIALTTAVLDNLWAISGTAVEGAGGASGLVTLLKILGSATLWGIVGHGIDRLGQIRDTTNSIKESMSFTTFGNSGRSVNAYGTANNDEQKIESIRLVGIGSPSQ